MSDDFDLEANDDDVTESSAIKQMRSQLEQLQKELKQEKKARLEDATALASYKTKEREQTVKEVFKDIPETVVNLWLRANPEEPVTPEVAQQLRTDLGLTEATDSTAVTPPPQTYQPIVGATPAPTGAKISVAELAALHRQDPAGALRAIEEGRVETPNRQFFGG